MKKKQLNGVLYILPFVTFWALFLAWPVIYGIFISLFEWQGMRGIEFIGFSNYLTLFNDAHFWNAFFNTLKFAGMVIPLIVGLGLLFALMIWGWGKGRRGIRFIQSALFFPYLLTISIVSLTWLWLLDRDYGLIQYLLRLLHIPAPHLLSSVEWVLPTIVFVTAWKFAGYRMLIFQAGLEDIPYELFEAAELQGASHVRKFISIILPLLKPSLLFTIVLTIIAGFRAFGQVLIMTEGGPGRASEVLALYLYRTGFEYFEPGKAAATGVILLLMIMGLTMVAVKFIGLKSELQ